MSLISLSVTGYRSIRWIRFPVRRLSVLVGGNGVGKTNLYRSLELLQSAATGTLAMEIAREGGLSSLYFAGERKRNEPPRLVLEATLEEILDQPVHYSITIGFPTNVSAAFPFEAQVKEEKLSVLNGRKPVELMDRKPSAVWARDGDGNRILAGDELLASETALSDLRGSYREIDAVRHAVAGWRFYHAFRTDTESPLRRPSLAVTSPTLASDGSNLAAVFATLRHVRQESVDLDDAIDQAFPGARLSVPKPETMASFAMSFPDLPKREFGAHELSDGTLQYLALMGALLAYRLPGFIALNEPETSLHPRLLPALAKLIVNAAKRTQIWVVTHSQEFADAIAEESGVRPRQVIRRDGSTWLEGLTLSGDFEEDL